MAIAKEVDVNFFLFGGGLPSVGDDRASIFG
jgi:hypothetical protein